MNNAVKCLSLAGTTLIFVLLVMSCKDANKEAVNQVKNVLADPGLEYNTYTPKATDIVISRSDYVNKLYGFWLGQCIVRKMQDIKKIDGAFEMLLRRRDIPAQGAQDSSVEEFDFRPKFLKACSARTGINVVMLK